MRPVSSGLTVYAKVVFPTLGFVFIAGFFCLAVIFWSLRPSFPWPVLAIPLVVAGFGYVICRKLCFDLLDEVYDAGDHLLVRNSNREDRVPLTHIADIDYNTGVNPPRVTLRLSRPCAFGDKVVFMAPVSFIPMKESPLITDLIRRVRAAGSGPVSTATDE